MNTFELSSHWLQVTSPEAQFFSIVADLSELLSEVFFHEVLGVEEINFVGLLGAGDSKESCKYDIL